MKTTQPMTLKDLWPQIKRIATEKNLKLNRASDFRYAKNLLLIGKYLN